MIRMWKIAQAVPATMWPMARPMPVADSDQAPHWHVTFTVHDRDATAAAAEQLGGSVLNRGDTEWTRDALLRDPQGAVFTVSQFTPPT